MNKTTQQPPHSLTDRIRNFVRVCFLIRRSDKSLSDLESEYAAKNAEWQKRFEEQVKRSMDLAERRYRRRNAIREKIPPGYTFEYLGRLVVRKGFDVIEFPFDPEAAVFKCEYADDNGVIHPIEFEAETLLALLGITVEEPETEAKESK